MLEKLILLALGWLAGTLSPIVVDAIRTRRESIAVVAAIKGELNEVAYRLVLADYMVAKHLGTVDREVLKRVEKAIAHYSGTEPTSNIAELMRLKLSLDDLELDGQTRSEAAGPNDGLVLPKFAVPYVDARVAAWHAIPASIRLELQAVRSDIRLLDDLTEQSRTYFSMTFGKHDPENHATLWNNLRNVYGHYARRCGTAADRMHRVHSVL